MIRFVCPHCDAVTLGIDDDLAGEAIMCRHCHRRSYCVDTPEDLPRKSGKALWFMIAGGIVFAGSVVAIVLALLPPSPQPAKKQVVKKETPDYAAQGNELILRQKSRAVERRIRHSKEFEAGVRKSNEKMQDFLQKTLRWNMPILDEYERTGLEKTLPLLELLQKFDAGPALTKAEIDYCLKKPKVYGAILKLTQNGSRPLQEQRRAIDAEAASYRTKMQKISATIDGQIERIEKICDLVQANEMETALVACARAIKEDPSHPEPWVVKGAIAGLVKNDPGRALVDLERALALEKENPDAFLARGIIYLRSGNKTRARADYQAAILIDTSLTKHGELFRD